MKRLLATLLFAGTALTAAAQDRIVKTDNSSIEARVLEISPETVRYKRFSNPDGPTYVLPAADIRLIRFANGEVEEFSKAAPEPAAPAPAPVVEPEVEPAPDPAVAPTVVPPAAPAAEAEASAAALPGERFAVGDYYERNGVKGVVIAVTDEGRHGLLISLEQKTLLWDTAKKENRRFVGANNPADGAENLAAVARYVAETGTSWEEFPLFDWCRQLGEGWYVPAIDEWLTIGFNLNGGDRSRYNRTSRTQINNALKEHGGKRLDSRTYYFTSTERDDRSALVTSLAAEPPYRDTVSKSGISYPVRAVRKF